jgi:hypothetical protein
MLSVIVLSVNILSAIMHIIVLPSDIMLSVILLGVVKHNFNMLSLIMLNVSCLVSLC